MKKIIELVINDDAQLELGVDAIALVENPAIEENFLYFEKESFVEPSAGEDEGTFIGRCMSDLEGEFPDQEQRLAVCYSYWRGSAEFEDLEDACWPGYEAIGLKPGKGGRMVPNCVPVKQSAFESYNDYPESAKAAAKRALEWRDAHPDQGCGTAVGWARANQLAKGENISEETIARMASFARHLQYKDVPYSEGCGGLMVDAWGGQAGIEWAQNKLEDIREQMSDEMFWVTLEDGEIDVLGYNTKNFKLCPGATATFQHLISMAPDEDAAGMIRSAALQADAVFGIEQEVLDRGVATKEDLMEATIFVKDFMDLMQEIDKQLGMQHDVSYMYGHLEVIGNLIPEEEFAIDTAGLPVYVDEITEDKKKKQLLMPFSAQEMAWTYKFANTEGYSRVAIERLFRDPKNRQARKYRTPVYAYQKEYTGRVGDRREWCSKMMGRNTGGLRFYFYTDIIAMRDENEEFGHGRGGAAYNKYNWQGGPNCVHAWKEFRWNYEEDKLEEIGWAKGQAGRSNRGQTGRGYYDGKPPRRQSMTKVLDENGQQYAFNEEKRIVTGPLMIPNMEIPRKAEDGSKYYVYFTEETIRQIAEKFIREKKLDRTNIEHDSEDIRNENYLFETWIVENPEMDKAKALGFSVPKGTWMGSMRVMDDTTWKLVKDGKIKGFSVEGFFGEMKEKKKFYSMRACPVPTKNLEVNTLNRNRAIVAPFIEYGPLNVDKPEGYWEHLAEHWKTSVEAAKSSTCGNCAAFDISPRMDECMPGVTSDKDGVLGYCWMHHFKCHSARSCYTWAAGGSITEDQVSYEWQARNLEAAMKPGPISAPEEQQQNLYTQIRNLVATWNGR